MTPRAHLAHQIARRQMTWGFGANLVGAGVAFAYLALVFPPDPDYGRVPLGRNLVALGIYLPLAMAISTLRVRRASGALREWSTSSRPPTELERRLVLRLPVINALWTGGLWLVAAVVFALLNLDHSGAFAYDVLGTVVLVGVAVTTAEFLGNERLLRPAAALVLSTDPPPEAGALGVAPRIMLTWVAVAAAPLIGIALVPTGRVPDDASDLALPLGFLAAAAVAAGAVAMTLAARAVSAPLRRVRGAMDDVTAGRLDVVVNVDDGSEIGRLEAGFNRMVEGLRERERLREAFGIFVDPELGERILREGTDLGGEELPVSILFLDVRGFTAMAEQRSPREVVSLLNELYERVVPTVIRHGGHANKFIGDGMLAIFGAPERHGDHADRAVAAALEIAGLVRADFGDRLSVGIGVNSGRVLVGTIGGGGRLDFTVIGDPVNTAARVEAATRTTGDAVLITEATRKLLERDHGGFEERPPVPLKGKTAAVRLFAPSDR